MGIIFGIDRSETPRPPRLVKAKSAFEIAGIEIIVENAANAARFIAVLEVEILVAPRLVAGVIACSCDIAGRLHGGVEGAW